MRIKDGAIGMAMGVGATLMYQQVKNGNMKKMMKDIKSVSKKTINDLEDMM